MLRHFDTREPRFAPCTALITDLAPCFTTTSWPAVMGSAQ